MSLGIIRTSKSRELHSRHAYELGYVSDARAILQGSHALSSTFKTEADRRWWLDLARCTLATCREIRIELQSRKAAGHIH